MNKLDWQRKQRAERKSKGLCVSCGNPTNKYTSCDECRQKEKQRNQKNRELKICNYCSNQSIAGKNICEKCSKKRTQKSFNRRIKRKQLGLCSSCNQQAMPNMCLCEKCNNSIKLIYQKNKKLVFTNYGYKCNHCGECNSEFLQIDHINGGGNKHVKSLTVNFYRWLIKNNFPKEFQTLCANCNKLKSLKENNFKLNEERIKCFDIYGGATCKYCGEKRIEVLEIDHINGNGSKMRKEDSRHKKIHQWLRLNNYPEGYQVLCANCHWAKRLNDKI